MIGLVVETQLQLLCAAAFPQSRRGRLRVAHVGQLQRALRDRPVRREVPPAQHRGHFVHVYVDRAHAPARGIARRAAEARSRHCGRRIMSTSPDAAAVDAAHHLAPLGARLPAHAGAAREIAATSSRRLARAVGHQHPALARARADRRGHAPSCRAASAPPTTTPRERATPRRGVRLLPDAMGSRRTSTGGARSAGTCTACSASPRATRSACTRSTAATTCSSTRRWA